MTNNFELYVPYVAPQAGDSSRNLRVVSEQWSPSHDQLTLNVQGVSGQSYDIGVIGAEEIESVDGGVVGKNSEGRTINLAIPNDARAGRRIRLRASCDSFQANGGAEKTQQTIKMISNSYGGSTTVLRSFFIAVSAAALLACAATVAHAQSPATTLKIDWDNPGSVSKTTPTLQVVVNPLLRRSSPIHDQAFSALKEMQADYVRYVPWMPYPLLGVAELQPPHDGKTFWDFSLIDPARAGFFPRHRRPFHRN